MTLVSHLPPPLPPRSRLSQALTRGGADRRLTVEQYQRMVEEGVVPEDSTIELLRGVLVRKDRSAVGEDPMGHSPIHRVVVNLLTRLTARLANHACHIQIQLPVECPPDGAPEPDGAIVRGDVRDYISRLPGPADVCCVIEAAHSSLDRDREDKLSIYAESGIPQYIIVDLQTMNIEVFSAPDPQQRRYRTRTLFHKGQSLELNIPTGTLTVAADDLLP